MNTIRIKDKEINLIDLILNIYVFLFVFSMTNREFLFLGMDLRYILMLLGAFLILYKIITYRKYYNSEKNKDINFINIAIFYIWCLLSNISWFWNGLKLETGLFINQIILITNNLIILVVLHSYRQYINKERVYKFIIFSCIVLLISFIFVGLGYKLSEISGTDARGISITVTEGSEQKNMFGKDFRIAGYAEDANYASLLWVIGIIATIKSNIRKKYKVIFTIAFFICFGLSWSKTLVLALIIVAVIMIIIRFLKLNEKKMKVVNTILLLGTVFSIIIMPKIEQLRNYMPATITTRFSMWNFASELFIESPIIGNGIDSFKSYINEQYNGSWYVQCHSTYWQILSEVGIIGMILFINILYYLLNNINNKPIYFLTLVYIIWIGTYESIALQFSMGILYLLQIPDEEDVRKE